MSWVPPRVARRVLVAPVALVLAATVVVASPVLALVAAIVDLGVGRHRSLRTVAFCTAYCAYEVACLVAVFWLWVRSGAGLRLQTPASQDRHYRLMEWWLRAQRGVTSRLFGVEVRQEVVMEHRDGPVLVFARHGGAGNSLMLVATLMLEYQRKPRIIMLEKLQWEPVFDVLLNRLPNAFIRHGGPDREAQLAAISALASGLGDDGAFVLFPEGHDFRADLRERAIAHLRKRGQVASAEKAEAMINVLPPRHGGVTAAITAAPGADVIFVAHTVFEDVGSLAELWRRLPLDRPVLARAWRVPAAEVPHDPEELIAWLYAWWASIDRWISDRVAPHPAPPVGPDPAYHAGEPGVAGNPDGHEAGREA